MISFMFFCLFVFSNGVRVRVRGGAHGDDEDDERGRGMSSERYRGSGSCAFRVDDLRGGGRDVCGI